MTFDASRSRGWGRVAALGLSGVVCAVALGVLSGCAGMAAAPLKYDVQLRRTAMGVPHVLAADAAGLGYGLGYAQAEDALCTIADSMLTYRGERSRWFGAQALTATRSTSGRPRNIDSDFFHRHVLNEQAVAAFAQAQPAEVQQLMTGFADGYNRYLGELRANAGSAAHAACRQEGWVTPITVQDLQRRAYASNFAAGLANFLPNIANAQPPAAAIAAAASPALAAATRVGSFEVGGTEGVGSNVYGLGAEATGGASILFGNPHWYWRGPDRFYQAQLTIPGTLNVAGATFLGIPVILIGYNQDVAWSHTVSTARRFGFFQLTLQPGSPTTYLRDGAPVAMTATPISVPVREADGSLSVQTRTLYRTPQGPLVNLAALNPALAWTAGTAFVIRDINAENFRTFRTWSRWARARSLDEFAAIQREDAAIPWVNTVAVARGSAQAWYADIGAMPNVTPAQLASCTTRAGQAVAGALPNVPFLDGSRAACDWSSDADSRQAGAIGASRMPSLLRSDYVANMNDSFWLANPAAPLSGYAPLIGPAGTQAQTLRTRLGHLQVQQRLAGSDGLPGRGFSVDTLKQVALSSRVLSAELFKAEALALVCTAPTIAVAADAVSGATFAPPRAVDVAAACAALRAWDNSGRTESRGAHVWDEFWTRAARLPAAQLHSVPFSAADPVNTPRGVNPAAAAALQQAFGAAVLRVQESGFAVDATRGEVLFVTRGSRVPLYGGCHTQGYFTINCSEKRIEQGGYSMDGDPNANSYLQIVSFAGSGSPEVHTLLGYSLSDDPASPHHGDYTRRYAARQWLRMPFSEAEIIAHPDYRLQRLQAR